MGGLRGEIGGSVDEWSGHAHADDLAASMNLGHVAGRVVAIAWWLEPQTGEIRGGDADERPVVPHHRLGYTGRATRVEEPEIVARPARLGRRRMPLADEILVVEGPMRCGSVELDTTTQLGERVEHRFDGGCEVAIEEHRLGVGVVEEVVQLLCCVTEVDVAGHRTDLETSVLRFEVLDAVVGEEPDLGAPLDSSGDQSGGEAAGVGVELGPRAASIAVHDRLGVGNRGGNRLEGVGQVERRAVHGLMVAGFDDSHNLALVRELRP